MALSGQRSPCYFEQEEDDDSCDASYFDILVKLVREGGNTSDANISIIMNENGIHF